MKKTVSASFLKKTAAFLLALVMSVSLLVSASAAEKDSFEKMTSGYIIGDVYTPGMSTQILTALLTRAILADPTGFGANPTVYYIINSGDPAERGYFNIASNPSITPGGSNYVPIATAKTTIYEDVEWGLIGGSLVPYDEETDDPDQKIANAIGTAITGSALTEIVKTAGAIGPITDEVKAALGSAWLPAWTTAGATVAVTAYTAATETAAGSYTVTVSVNGKTAAVTAPIPKNPLTGEVNNVQAAAALIPQAPDKLPVLSVASGASPTNAAAQKAAIKLWIQNKIDTTANPAITVSEARDGIGTADLGKWYVDIGTSVTSASDPRSITITVDVAGFISADETAVKNAIAAITNTALGVLDVDGGASGIDDDKIDQIIDKIHELNPGLAAVMTAGGLDDTDFDISKIPPATGPSWFVSFTGAGTGADQSTTVTVTSWTDDQADVDEAAAVDLSGITEIELADVSDADDDEKAAAIAAAIKKVLAAETTPITDVDVEVELDTDWVVTYSKNGKTDSSVTIDAGDIEFTNNRKDVNVTKAKIPATVKLLVASTENAAAKEAAVLTFAGTKVSAGTSPTNAVTTTVVAGSEYTVRFVSSKDILVNDTKPITVEGWAYADVTGDLLAKAEALIPASIPTLGIEADPDDETDGTIPAKKVAAIKAYLEEFIGAGVVVTPTVIADGNDKGKWTISIAAGGSTSTAPLEILDVGNWTNKTSDAMDAALALITTTDLGTLSVASGAAGSSGDKEAAILARLAVLFPGLAVVLTGPPILTMTVAVIPGTSDREYRISFTGAKQAQAKTVTVAAWVDNQGDINRAAIAINAITTFAIDGPGLGTAATVAGTPAAQKAARKTALETYIKAELAKASTSITGVDVTATFGTNSWTIALRKGAATTPTTPVTAIADNGTKIVWSDNQKDVNDALALILTIPFLQVPGGSTADDSDKVEAIRVRITALTIPGGYTWAWNNFTITVLPAGSVYNVTLRKGNATGTKPVTVTTWTKP